MLRLIAHSTRAAWPDNGRAGYQVEDGHPLLHPPEPLSDGGARGWPATCRLTFITRYYFTSSHVYTNPSIVLTFNPPACIAYTIAIRLHDY